MKNYNLKKIKVRGKFYYTDFLGNLISADYVKESPIKIRTPKDVLPVLVDDRVKSQECVVVVTLDGNNQVINKHVVTQGLVNQSQVHPRETFRPAILDNAVSVIIAHNHPSGNLEASESDLSATKRLSDAGKLLGITVLDHLILTSLSYLSIRERHPAYFN